VSRNERRANTGGISGRFRLLELYRAARSDGHEPKPELERYRSARRAGFVDAVTKISEIVRPTELADYCEPQFTLGYYDGVSRAVGIWAEQVQAESADVAESMSVDPNAADAATDDETRDRDQIGAQIADLPPVVLRDDAERRMLERVITLLCQHVDQLVTEVRRPGTGMDREIELQADVYQERKKRALVLIRTPSKEPREIRLYRELKVIDALESSSIFFRSAIANRVTPDVSTKKHVPRRKPQRAGSRLFGSLFMGFSRTPSTAGTR
jgi:hypothetical protein